MLEQMEKDNLQPIKSFMEKVIQLYDMIKCRHGLMLVGPAGVGKSTTYKVLSKAITKYAEEAESKEIPVEVFVLNPKAVTMA